MLAYTVGVNAFGLVLGLIFVLGSLLHLDLASVAGLIGGLASVALAVIAGWRTYKALKGFLQD